MKIEKKIKMYIIKNTDKLKFTQKITKMAQNVNVQIDHRWKFRKKMQFSKISKNSIKIQKLHETHKNSQNDTKMALKCPN